MKVFWIIGGFILGALGASCIYLFGAWCAWSFDPARWDTMGRFLAGVFMLLVFAYSAIYGLERGIGFSVDK